MRILERAFERAGKPFSKDILKPGLPRLARKEVEDVLAAVGRGELPSTDVVKAVYPDYQDTRVTSQNSPAKTGEKGWFNIQNAAGMIFKVPEGSEGAEKPETTGEKPKRKAVPIRGTNSDLPVRFAPEGAVPGDRIVGIMQPGAGITIYPIQSPALTAYDDQPERWIDVRWDIDEGCMNASRPGSVCRQLIHRDLWLKLRRSLRRMTPIFIISQWCEPRPILLK